MALGTDKILVVIDAATQGFTGGMKSMSSEAKKAETSIDGIGKKAGGIGDLLKKGLVAGAAALAGGTLVKVLQDSVDAYGDAAKAAGELASATGGSVENVSRMQAALQDAGIGAEKFTGLMTKFTTGAGKNKKLLQDLGVQFKINADGSIDYADAMVQAVDAIQNIGDASKRNAALVQLFGKQGATAFQELYASGMDLSDAMELVSKYRVFDAADVQRAQVYDDAMDSLKGAFQGVQFTLGEALIPAVSGFAGALESGLAALTPVIEFLGDIPGEVYLVVGAFTALKFAMGTDLMKDGISNLAKGLYGLQGLWDKNATGMTNFKNAAKGAGSAMVGLAKGVGGMVLAAGAIAAYTDAAKSAKNTDELIGSVEGVSKSLRDQAKALEENEGWWASHVGNTDTKMQEITQRTDELTQETLDNADATDAQRAAAQALQDVINAGIEPGMSNAEILEIQTRNLEGATQEQQDYARAMAGANQIQIDMANTGKELSDAIADIVTNGGDAATTWSDVAEGAQAAAGAQANAATATELTAIAMGEYAASIQQAIGWEKRLAGYSGDVEGAVQGIADAFYDTEVKTDSAGNNIGYTLVQIKDDLGTVSDESVSAFSDAKVAILEYAEVLADAGTAPREVAASLDALKIKFPELAGTIDEVKASIEGLPNEVTINTNFDVEGVDAQLVVLRQKLAEAQSAGDWQLAEKYTKEIEAIDPTLMPFAIEQAVRDHDYGLADSLTADYNAWALAHGADQVTITYDADGTAAIATHDELTGETTSTITYNADGTVAETKKDELTEDVDAAIKYNATFEPGGYEAVRARKDYLTEDSDGTLKINTSFEPGGYESVKARLDYINSFDGKSPDINVYTHFDPAYNDVKARLDWINSQDGKTPDITIWTHWEPGSYTEIQNRIRYVTTDRTVNINFKTNGLAAAVAAVNSLSSGAAATNQSFRMPAAQPVPTNINLVRVSIDGQDLRATIREELGRVRDSDDLVAAMGRRA